MQWQTPVPQYSVLVQYLRVAIKAAKGDEFLLSVLITELLYAGLHLGKTNALAPLASQYLKIFRMVCYATCRCLQCQQGCQISLAMVSGALLRQSVYPAVVPVPLWPRLACIC